MFFYLLYVSGFDGTNWVCYKKLSDATSFTLEGTIHAGDPNTYAGLEVSADPTGRLVFIMQDGDDLRVYESFDSGETWNAA